MKIDVLEKRYLLSSPSSTAQFLVNTDTAGNQADPAVAINASGESIIVWENSASGVGPADIFARRFDASGQPVGEPFQINQFTVPGPADPSVAMNDSGDFVVTWQSGAENSDIFARQFDASAQPLGDEFDVLSSGTGEQLSPDVAIDAAGNFTVVWWEDIGTIGGVLARRFGADGTPMDDSFSVEPATHHGMFPKIAGDGSGEFVITWLSWSSADTGIHAQLFDPSGNPVGGEIDVDGRVPESVMTVPAAAPVAVDMNDHGDFVIAWRGYESGNTYEDAFARLYNALGVPRGTAFQVDDASTDHVLSVDATIGYDGTSAITWQSTKTGSTVYARRYDADGTPATNPFIVAAPVTQVPVLASDSAGNLLLVWQRGTESSGSDILARWRRPEAVQPSVVHAGFEYQTRQQLVIQFSEDVSQSLSTDDVNLVNQTSGQSVPASAMTIAYDVGTDTATVSFSNLLPDGNYRTTIHAADVTDIIGNALSDDVTIDFFVLAGDANHDRVVDVTDLGALATNWQQSGVGFGGGDFNYDGVVDVTDLGILATNWQKPLPPPPPAPLVTLQSRAAPLRRSASPRAIAGII